MNVKTGTPNTPPRLIASIVAGFNATTSHVWLILFPLALDLLIWLGPHLRLKSVFLPMLSETFDSAARLATPDMKDFFTANQQAAQAILEQFNLAGLLRTIPVGVPSLFSGQGNMDTPFGPAPVIELPSFGVILLAWLIIIVLGTLVGSLYMGRIAAITSGDTSPLDLPGLVWQTAQAIGLSVLMVVLILLIVFPLSFLMAFFSLLSPSLAQILLIVIGILAIWLIVPLVFSAHGIFTNRLNALLSISTSVRLVRFFLPGTGMLVFITVALVFGLNLLWSTPPASSWMALVGLAGHAFITTGLVAASFIYYQGGMRTMHAVLERLAAEQSKVV